MRAWRADYRTFVPAPVLAELTGADAAEVWRQRWAEAVTAPPSPRHRLLVAVASESVVGFAACGPAGEADHDPETSAELITLRVEPGHASQGHDSRLLAAVADMLRDDGFRTAITWVFEKDEAQRAFFVSAGWAPDGARRTLSFPAPSADGDATAPLTMIRMHTDISDTGDAENAGDTGLADRPEPGRP
jgi:GNAT superfamily N-acetyltransferase